MTAHERFAGETKYPLTKMMRFALDALTGFSSAPLKLASHVGLALSIGSVLLILYIAYAWAAGRNIQGWTSLMLIVVIIGAVQMFVLGADRRIYRPALQRSEAPAALHRPGGRGRDAREARLGYVAEATAKSDKPGGKGSRPTR